MVAELTVCVWFTALLLNLLQAIETEEQGRRAGQWNRGEGMKVANLLGEKSLMTASTFEGRAQVIVNNAVMKNGYTAAITCGCQWRHVCVVVWFYSIPSNFKRSFVFDPLLCFMVLCMHLSYGVTWSPLWKPKSGPSEAVGRWALVHCDAEVGQRQPHVVWQHAINQPDPRRFSSWENDSNSSIFLISSFEQSSSGEVCFNMRMYQLYSCFVQVCQRSQRRASRGDDGSRILLRGFWDCCRRPSWAEPPAPF